MEVAVRKKLRRIFDNNGNNSTDFSPITACGNRMDAMQPDSSYVADFFRYSGLSDRNRKTSAQR